VSEQWISENALAQIGKDQGFVIDLKKNMMYIINFGAKSYVETTLPLDYAKLLPPQMGPWRHDDHDGDGHPGNETKKIGNWNCSLYNMNLSVMGMAMPMKIWPPRMFLSIRASMPAYSPTDEGPDAAG